VRSRITAPSRSASGCRGCANSRTITRQELEARALRALKERFFTPGKRFDEFCRIFTEEMNRLRREHRTELAAAPREIASINRRSKEILELLLQGFRDEAWKEELRTLEQRRTELNAIVAAAKVDPPLPALHPQMAEVFRQKATALAAALEHDDKEQREAARQVLRGFIDRIVIPSGDGLL
jgi:site-specific DNA recombinase